LMHPNHESSVWATYAESICVRRRKQH